MKFEHNISAELLKAAICGLTEVVHTNQGFEVTLPQVYHSGHSVCVIVRQNGQGFLIHDNSYAAMLLSSHGVSIGKKLNARLGALVESYGCGLEGMRVYRNCDSSDHVALAASLVGCASRLVADTLLEAKKPPIFDFKSSLLGKVTELVGERRVRTNQDVTGHLGSHYRVSTVVLDEAERKPIAFVEPVTDRDAVSRRFKEFYDIMRNPLHNDVSRVAVLDEENNLPAGDSLLLQEVSSLVRFTDMPTHAISWKAMIH